jgi:hypothetical protein
LGYKIEQGYDQVGTAQSTTDQRYYSFQWHFYTSADYKLEPTIYIPEEINLDMSFSINEFFGSIFVEGVLWWGTGSSSQYALCGGVGYFLQDLLI